MSNNIIKIVFFLFFFFFFISYYSMPGIGVLRYAGMGLLAAAAYIVILTDKKNYVWKGVNERPIILLLNFVLLAGMMFMGFFATDQVSAMLKIFSLILLFILTFIMIPPLIHRIGIVSFNKTMLFSAAIAIAIAYIIRPDGYSYTGGLRIGMDERLELFFVHPNTLGAMCFLGIVLIMYNYQKKDITTFLSKAVYGSMAVIFAVLLYQSDSRTSIYALMIFAILLLYKNIPKSKTTKIISDLSIGIFLLLLITSILDFITYDNINHLLSQRMDYWFLAFHHMSEQGSLLVGEGSYIREENSAVLLDSSYVYTLYHSGLIPLIFLCGLVVYLFIAIKETKDQKDKIFIESFFAAFLFISFFENVLFNLSIVYSIIFFSYIYYFLRYRGKEAEYI